MAIELFVKLLHFLPVRLVLAGSQAKDKGNKTDDKACSKAYQHCP